MSSPLLDRLTQELGYPLLDIDGLDAFLGNNEYSVLFFTEDPKRYPETNDVAVVLPELVKAFDGRFTPAVIERGAEKTLQTRYGFKVWPALVFLRGNAYLGTITKIQDWSVYLERVGTLLNSEPSRPPGVGIPVVGG